jgi:TPR repeat protein
MAVLSKVYLFGTHNKKIVTQQQPDKSFAYANQSSHLGSAQGHDMLAFHLRFGLGVEQNRDKARILDGRGASVQYLPSMMAVAYQEMYEYADDRGKRRCASAEGLYRAAAGVAMQTVNETFAGDYSSVRLPSPTFDEMSDDDTTRAARQQETIDYWSFLADRKDPRALLELGRVHQLGLHNIAPPDLTLAVDYYNRASALGDPDAQALLGKMQSVGQGTPQDMPSALRNLRASLESRRAFGHAQLNDSESCLGNGHATGAGCIEGTAEATLGAFLRRGVFTDHSPSGNLMRTYLEIAARLGNSDAMYELGMALDSSSGDDNDGSGGGGAERGGGMEALDYFRDASRMGHVLATAKLASHYSHLYSRKTKTDREEEEEGEEGKEGEDVCVMAVSAWTSVCAAGPWLDEPWGARAAIRAYREGRNDDALLLALYWASRGLPSALYSASWLILRREGWTADGIRIRRDDTNGGTARRRRKHRKEYCTGSPSCLPGALLSDATVSHISSSTTDSSSNASGDTATGGSGGGGGGGGVISTASGVAPSLSSQTPALRHPEVQPIALARELLHSLEAVYKDYGKHYRIVPTQRRSRNENWGDVEEEGEVVVHVGAMIALGHIYSDDSSIDADVGAGGRRKEASTTDLNKAVYYYRLAGSAITPNTPPTTTAATATAVVAAPDTATVRSASIALRREAHLLSQLPPLSLDAAFVRRRRRIASSSRSAATGGTDTAVPTRNSSQLQPDFERARELRIRAAAIDRQTVRILLYYCSSFFSCLWVSVSFLSICCCILALSDTK